MKRFVLLLIFLTFLAAFSFGQPGPASAPRYYGKKASDPATCVEGSWYYNTTSHAFKYCSATNTWSALGGGGITNGAGANIIPKSDGTNLVASSFENASSGVFRVSASPDIQFGDVLGDGTTTIGFNSGKTIKFRDNSGNLDTVFSPGGWLIVTPNKRLTTSPTNATTTMSNLTDLSIAAVAGQKICILYHVIANDSTAADGLKFDFGGGSATFTSIEFAFVTAPPGVTLGTVQSTTSTTAITATTATTTDVVYQIYVTAVINAAGTFVPRFAQVAHSTGTATAKTGSDGIPTQPSN